MRNFYLSGLKTHARLDPGGVRHPVAHDRHDTLGDPYILAFERFDRRSPFVQAMLDVAAVLSAALLVIVTGMGLFFAFFLLFTG